MKALYRTASSASLLSLAITTAGTAYGQTAPDAGMIYQESQQDELSPKQPSVDIRIQGQPLTQRDAGGSEVEICLIQFTDATAFSSEQLLAELGEDVFEKTYDLSGLQVLANRISEFYRAQGFPFARAILPPQTLDNGTLQITIIEGRYGNVSASGEPELAGTVGGFLHSLAPGEVIESSELERTLLIAGDLPGLNVVPVMRSGQKYGTGNLDLEVKPGDRVNGRLGIDNHGSRYSGEYRTRADLQTNRLLTVGDELSIAALYSSEDTWLGQLSYSLPLGYSGLRGSVGYDFTDYTLGKSFEGYTGTAEVLSAGLSYPLIRSQQSNLSLSATYQHKDLDDNADFIGYAKATESRSLPVTLQFDHYDNVFGGGIDEGEDRNISGAGLGLRINHGDWNADMISAWKLDGGDAQSDGRQRDPRFWFNASYRF